MGAAEGSTSAKTLSVCLQDRKHCRWQTRIRRRLHRGDNPKYPFVCLFVFPGKSAAVTTPQPPCQFRVLCPAGDAERCGAMRSSPDTLDSSGEARPAGGGRGSTGNAAPRGGHRPSPTVLGASASLSSSDHTATVTAARRGDCWTGVMACPGLRREANCRKTASTCILSKVS